MPQRPAPSATQLQGQVSYTQPAPAIPTLGEPATWQALLDGQAITDKEARQLFHTLDMASYQPVSTHQAKVYKALARELLLRNQLAATTVNDDGELDVNGTAMTRQQASLYYGDALDKRLDDNEALQPKAWLKGYLQQREYDRIKAVDSEGVRDVTLELLADIPLPQLRVLKAVPLLRHLHTARKLLEVSDDLGYVRVPSWFPNQSQVPKYQKLKRAKEKTHKKGAGKRERWKDEKGNIYEWDYQHGRLEKYDKQGKHLGEFDPMTGRETKAANKTRRIEP